MTRLELANQIAALINANEDLGAKVWTKNGRVRAYVTKNTGGKRGWIDTGFCEITAAGSVEFCGKVEFELRILGRVELEAIKAMPAAEAEALPEVTANRAAATASRDEDVEQFERSHRTIEARESGREIG
jgi:hypothetical protein